MGNPNVCRKLLDAGRPLWVAVKCPARAAGSLEPPDKAGGCAVIVLRVAGVMRVHVIALNTPGEILEKYFVIKAAANVDHQRVIHKGVGRANVPNAGHGMDERPDLTDIGGEAGATDNVVLP